MALGSTRYTHASPRWRGHLVRRFALQHLRRPFGEGHGGFADGALLGALNGMKIFAGHEDLIEGLWRKEEIIAAVDAFCDKFGIHD